jgi:hypothetical protein
MTQIIKLINIVTNKWTFNCDVIINESTKLFQTISYQISDIKIIDESFVLAAKSATEQTKKMHEEGILCNWCAGRTHQ